MADLHDDEILSAALDGEPDALRAIESRSDLRARLEAMNEARQALRSHRFDVPDEVRETNVSAALAAFDVQFAAGAPDGGDPIVEVAAVTPISQARSARRGSRAPFAIGSAAAVLVAAVIGLSMLGGSDKLDSASDDSAADDSATELPEAASSAPSGGADDALTPEQGLALDEAGAEAQMSTADTAEVAETEAADDDSGDAAERADGTATTAALVPLGPIPDEFEVCTEAIDMPVRPWVGGALEPRVDAVGNEYVYVTVADDTGVVFSVGFVPESCEVVEPPVLVEPPG